MIAEKKYYTSVDIAKMVGLTNPTIRNYISKGIIQPDLVLPSGRLKFSQETVDKFLESLQIKK